VHHFAGAGTKLFYAAHSGTGMFNISQTLRQSLRLCTTHFHNFNLVKNFSTATSTVALSLSYRCRYKTAKQSCKLPVYGIYRIFSAMLRKLSHIHFGGAVA
jgi:hypothetical protein